MLAETEPARRHGHGAAGPTTRRHRRWSPTRGCRWCRSPGRGRSATPSATAVPHKHVTLELGGNAAALVCADWSSEADLDCAADRIATFANYQAGQSCIAVQRVLVDASVLRRAGRRGWSRRSGRCVSATPPTRRPRSGRSSTRRRRSASRRGSTRPLRRARRLLTGGVRDGVVVRADRARRRAGRRAGAARRGVRPGAGGRAVRRARRRPRDGQRLTVRPAGRRVHPRRRRSRSGRTASSRSAA